MPLSICRLIKPAPGLARTGGWFVARVALVLCLACGLAAPPADAAAPKPAQRAKAGHNSKAAKATTNRAAVVSAAPNRPQAGRKGKARARGPVVINLPSPPAALLTPLEPPAVRAGCLGTADDVMVGYTPAQLEGWLDGPAYGAQPFGLPCRPFAAVQTTSTAPAPELLALLAFGGTRALLVNRPGAADEPQTEWLEIDPDGTGLRELWLPSTLGPGGVEGVPAHLQNELVLLARHMKKHSGAPDTAQLRVWVQGDDDTATLEALELVDSERRQAYESAVWMSRPDAPGAYVSSRGVEYERMLWQSPVDHLRVSRGIGASSMLVKKRMVTKTKTKKGRTRTRIVVHSFRYNSQHIGIDFAAPTGTPVVAVADGEVEFSGWRGGYGNLIVMRHGDELTTYYGHLSAFAPGLQTGLRVRRGQLIGLVGSTGFSTGPHLHFEIRKNGHYVDPTRADVQLPVWTLQPAEHQALLARLLQLELTRQRGLPGGTAQPTS